MRRGGGREAGGECTEFERPRGRGGGGEGAGGAEETEAADIRKAKDNERKCDKADLSCSQFPKVLVTVRSELLSSQQDYQSSFLPIESRNGNKDEAHEVLDP